MKLLDVPDSVPRVYRPLGHRIGRGVLYILGWRLVGKIPEHPKAIYAVAPHTSNWDFVIGISVMLSLNLKLKFMGKDAIFIWPFKGLLKSLGGIPINRREKHGVVEQIVEQFEQSEQLILALSPEGTRSKTKEWKTGFLAIAHQANVPVVSVSFHFDKKEVRFGETSFIDQDIAKELIRIKHNFSTACAKNPQAV